MNDIVKASREIGTCPVPFRPPLPGDPSVMESSDGWFVICEIVDDKGTCVAGDLVLPPSPLGGRDRREFYDSRVRRLFGLAFRTPQEASRALWDVRKRI